MSGRTKPLGSQRAPGARHRRTSAETAAAFLDSFQRRGGKWAQDPKGRRLRAIRKRAKPARPAWQAEVSAQRRAMEAGERPTIAYSTIRRALGPVLSDMLGFPAERAP